MIALNKFHQIAIHLANSKIKVHDGFKYDSKSVFSACSQIIKAKNIKELSFYLDYHIDAIDLEIFDALSKNTSISALKIPNCRGTYPKYLSEVLKTNKTVKRLDLSGHRMNAADLQALSDSLKKNKHLVEVDLSQSLVKDPNGLNVIFETLQINSSIVKLNIRHLDVFDKNTSFSSLRSNKSLRDIDLSDNFLGDEGCKLIADILKTNDSLKDINLSHNVIQSAGFKELSEALKVNITLKKINLSANTARLGEIKMISEAIKVNKSLTELDLSELGFDLEGTKALADALRVNATISRIHLSKNRIDRAGAMQLTEVLKVNETLAYIDLSNNFIDDDCAHSILVAIKPNRTFKLVWWPVDHSNEPCVYEELSCMNENMCYR
jgi:hypothetical protein